MQDTATETVVRRWFDALEAGDVDTAMKCLADDIRWINSPGTDGAPGGVPGLSAIVPWFGDFASKAEVMATFGPYAAAQETLSYRRLSLMVQGDEALALVRETARIRATGLVYDIEFVQRYRVAGGRIVLLRAYLDTSRMVAAFRGDLPARLLAAVRDGDAALARHLLANGANPNEADPQTAEPALSLAAAGGDEDMVRTLLAHGAEPNLVCRRSGDAPLHAASRSGAAGIVEALLQAGALADLRNPVTGKTPLEIARDAGFGAGADFLSVAGTGDGSAGGIETRAERRA